jgi:hypothetical protein
MWNFWTITYAPSCVRSKEQLMAKINYNNFTQWDGTELSEPEMSVHERVIYKIMIISLRWAYPCSG